MNERIIGWMNKWMKEQLDEWINECKNNWMIEYWMNEQCDERKMNERMKQLNVWINEWNKLDEWMNERTIG